MRILEAWARGVAVVGTPEAVRGLGVRDGEGVLLARSPEEFGAAVARLVKVERLRSTLLEQGRQVLRERHNPERVAQAWRSLFSSLRQSRS
jgi:glycosyltransferase involved in cell wall biosynthesis